MKPVTFDVPQGSVLGSLLLIIYINDLVNSSTDGLFRIFVDDTSIYFHGSNIETLVVKAELILVKTNKWVSDSKLTNNPYMKT